uniref:FYVE-type domain-containing protein n=1 Tax=Panagrolaimus sp. PS1159 TaxID=55785 RepID=A0AC35GKB2_9BILA
MAAIINERPCSSASSLGDGKPEFISKIENQIARINALYLLQREEGLITISEDRAIRVLLKRDSGQFWPSIVEFLTSIPLSLYYDEDTLSLLVGMINGTVYEYTIAADFNSIQQKRHWEAHTMGVTGVVSSNSARMIFSCSKDKTIVWHCADTSVKIGSYTIESQCTTIKFDPESKICFVGDYNGSIFVLRIVGNSGQQISKLSAHTAAITSLAWDSKRGILYSGSADTLVIGWDIAGQKGNCYELNGHDSKISALVIAENPARLFSVDESGHLVCWDLKAKRIMAPGWHDHDRCELCDVPFFWNVKLCWERKCVGVRRHHCRTCGHSVCGNCCNHWTTFPAMGFEKKTRICNTCHSKMQQYPDQFDLTPLAVQCELNKGIATMYLHEDTGKLAAVSFDRSIMLWDVSKLL